MESAPQVMPDPMASPSTRASSVLIGRQDYLSQHYCNAKSFRVNCLSSISCHKQWYVTGECAQLYRSVTPAQIAGSN